MSSCRTGRPTSPPPHPVAARYGVNELNGFASWFGDLTDKQPEAVQDVLRECIRGEWKFAADREHVHGVLNDLVWHGQELIKFITPTLLDLVRQGDPKNAMILQQALTILVRDDQSDARELGLIARDRLITIEPSGGTFLLWLTLMMQIDAEVGLTAYV